MKIPDNPTDPTEVVVKTAEQQLEDLRTWPVLLPTVRQQCYEPGCGEKRFGRGGVMICSACDRAKLWQGNEQSPRGHLHVLVPSEKCAADCLTCSEIRWAARPSKRRAP